MGSRGHHISPWTLTRRSTASHVNMCFVRKANLVPKNASDTSKYRSVFVYVDYRGHPKGPEGEEYNLAVETCGCSQ